MAYKWGDTNLNIRPETYQAFYCESGLTEIAILPGMSGSGASVLQQAGRTRKRVAFDGFVRTWAGYTSLLNDHVAATVKSFSEPNGSMNMIILSLSEPTMIFDDIWDYSIVLVEA